MGLRPALDARPRRRGGPRHRRVPERAVQHPARWPAPQRGRRVPGTRLLQGHRPFGSRRAAARHHHPRHEPHRQQPVRRHDRRERAVRHRPHPCGQRLRRSGQRPAEGPVRLQRADSVCRRGRRAGHHAARRRAAADHREARARQGPRAADGRHHAGSERPGVSLVHASQPDGRGVPGRSAAGRVCDCRGADGGRRIVLVPRRRVGSSAREHLRSGRARPGRGAPRARARRHG